jgi:hypothetical protein
MTPINTATLADKYKYYRPKELPWVDHWRAGIIFRLASLWIGIHWSAKNRRLCINFIPCVTFYLTLAGGDLPNMADYPYRWALRK